MPFVETRPLVYKLTMCLCWGIIAVHCMYTVYTANVVNAYSSLPSVMKLSAEAILPLKQRSNDVN